MSVEFPKPVAHILSNGVLTHVDLNEDDALFTESQILAYAAKCVEAERAKHAALVDAADGLRDALIESRRELQAIQAAVHLHGGFNPAYVKGAQASLKSSHDTLVAYEEARK